MDFFSIVLLTVACIFVIGIAVAVYVYYHPQLIVGRIQNVLYKNKRPINSYEPFDPPMRMIKENKQLLVTEIGYGTEYPNSFLDILYPSEDTSVRRPTVIYFHGGGFFGGDKRLGDPLAVDDDANRLFEEVAANGFNFVNVNYALVPDYHFPVPLIQMNQAIEFLLQHDFELGLDMENVVLFGQSAGAVLVGQYGSLLANEEYQKILGITPSIKAERIKALIIDDAPFMTEKFGLKLKLMTGNYLGTMNMQSPIAKKSNAYEYITKGYRPTFLTAGNTDGFPDDMSAFAQKLTEVGTECEYFFVPKNVCELPHGYLNLVKENEHARSCFDHILSFMKKYSGGNGNEQIS
ncbi:TPA: alpha/beta hydrolase [Streptococcus suis]|nr:alpha/beta hydrolase [Streptococcus suis]HEL2725485.1 alpha/beta hydrolase [Streptococcus suis]HEM2547329.1 alpha/beta hydrolase [Streptococcus suis]